MSPTSANMKQVVIKKIFKKRDDDMKDEEFSLKT